MPKGYETANGTFDPTVNTLFINKEMLQSQPEYEQMFYLFHELRHALQYLHPESFDGLIARSRLYVIQYDGTCYKLVDGEWKECKLDGSTEHFTELYLGQPYERDANDFAYEKVKELLGDSPELQELHAFWTPKKPIADQVYISIRNDYTRPRHSVISFNQLQPENQNLRVERCPRSSTRMVDWAGVLHG